MIMSQGIWKMSCISFNSIPHIPLADNIFHDVVCDSTDADISTVCGHAIQTMARTSSRWKTFKRVKVTAKLVQLKFHILRIGNEDVFF